MLRPRAARPRLWLLLLGSLLTFSPLAMCAAEQAPPPEGLTTPGTPTALPTFELPDAYGNTVRSAALQGKVVVVRFWATW